MTSEIRANTLKNRVGLGTVSFTNTGPVVSGIVTANTIRLADDNKIQLGDAQDLEIVHDSANGVIRSVNSGGNMHVESKNHIELNVNYNTSSGSKENALKAIANQGVSLFYNGAQKLQTTNTGATVTGTLVATTFDGNVTGNISGGTVAGSTGTFSGDVSITDKIVHTDDTDTNIRFHADDKFRIELGGLPNAFTGLKSTSGAPHAKWGINVATPQAAIHIDEGYNHQGLLRVTNGNQGTGYYHQLEMSGTNNIYTLWRHFDGTSMKNTHAHGSTAHIWYIGGNEKVRINSSGLVNIGAGSSTSGLSPLLHLHKNASNSSAYLHITNNDTGITNNDGFLLGINPSGDCLVFNKDSTPIRFATAGIERVRIYPSGELRVISSGNNNDPAHLRLHSADVSISTNDAIGVVRFAGRDSGGDAVSRTGALIQATAAATWDTGQSSGYSATHLDFFTQANSGTDTIAAGARLRIDSSGTVLVNKTSTSDYGKFEVKGGTADNIETADITAKTVATFSGSSPGTTAAGKGAGIVIKPIADRGCNYFLGVANDSTNQEAHGRFIIRSGNFAGQTTERLRINANGELQISGNCEPAADTTYDLGANVNNRWRNIYGQTLSLTSYAVIGSLVVNDPGSSYYSFNNRIQGNTIIKGTTVCTDDIGSVPSTFPASNVQLMVYTSTNGQPISNTDCARLLIATDAKQVGAQGYNGALDFGNSDATASGDSNQYEYRTASIMSNAAGDTGTGGYADGDLQFWTKSSSGSLTKRVVITQAGNTIFGNSISEGTTEPFFVETGGTIRRRYQTTNGSGIHFTGSALMPTTGTGAFSNGGINIGTGSYRWGQIYSSSSSISTSDRTLKNTIQSSDLGLEFIKKLNPVSYKFNDGNSGRTHYGLISQDVETVLTNLGKTGIDFGGFCKDKNTRVETKPDENGDIIDVNIEEEGHTYSLRYEEFIGPLIKAVQELSTEVETLKTKVAALEG